MKIRIFKIQNAEKSMLMCLNSHHNTLMTKYFNNLAIEEEPSTGVPSDSEVGVCHHRLSKDPNMIPRNREISSKLNSVKSTQLQ